MVQELHYSNVMDGDEVFDSVLKIGEGGRLVGTQALGRGFEIPLGKGYVIFLASAIT